MKTHLNFGDVAAEDLHPREQSLQTPGRREQEGENAML